MHADRQRATLPHIRLHVRTYASPRQCRLFIGRAAFVRAYWASNSRGLKERHMKGFDHILNWTLKKGSHPFPGPDGGTCINEAALVAMGFEYRPISDIYRMPRCFSRPICQFAMWLNDMVSDEKRQLLLPYVARLTCADTQEVEREREAYIQAQMRRGWLSIEKGIAILEGALA